MIQSEHLSTKKWPQFFCNKKEEKHLYYTPHTTEPATAPPTHTPSKYSNTPNTPTNRHDRLHHPFTHTYTLPNFK